MKKIILPLLLALSLSACATLTNPISNAQFAAVESAYGTALSVAVGYRDACAQRLIPPSCRPIVVQIQQYAIKAQGAVIAARNFIRNNPTVSAISIVGAAQAAVNDFKAVQAQYGVQ